MYLYKAWTTFCFRSLVKAGKSGGLIRLHEEILDRLYMVSMPMESHIQLNTTQPGKSISFFGIDVSHSGEATYIYRRFLSKRHFPFHHLVVDIGANDGLMSSNSFNFIQWGWDAILVEPLSTQLMYARRNTERYCSDMYQLYFKQLPTLTPEGIGFQAKYPY